jgi:hypothetical protein
VGLKEREGALLVITHLLVKARGKPAGEQSTLQHSLSANSPEDWEWGRGVVSVLSLVWVMTPVDPWRRRGPDLLSASLAPLRLCAIQWALVARIEDPPFMWAVVASSPCGVSRKDARTQSGGPAALERERQHLLPACLNQRARLGQLLSGGPARFTRLVANLAGSSDHHAGTGALVAGRIERAWHGEPSPVISRHDADRSRPPASANSPEDWEWGRGWFQS